MKIIRQTAFVAALVALTAVSSPVSAEENLSLQERDALVLAVDMIEGSEKMVGKNINAVCSELVQLLNDSQKWPELKALLGEYAELNLKNLKFYQRPGKVKEIIDRLNDLKNRGQLPQSLVDAVNQVNRALLLKRLHDMLAA